MRAIREILIGAFLALAIAAAGAGAAQAELSFSSPQTLFPVDTGKPRIGVDGQGRATVVAQQAGPGGSVLVQVKRLTPAGLPEPVDTLEEVANIGQCVCANLVVDPAGNATVLWVAAVEDEQRVAFVQIDANGVPGSVRLLSPAGLEDLAFAAAGAPDGSIAVAWESGGPDTHLEVARIDPEGNPEEPHMLTEPGEGGDFPALAAGPDSSFHVAWGQGGYGGVDYTVLDGEGAPGPTQTVSPEGEQANVPAIVVDDENRVTIAWYRGSGLYEDKVVRLDAEGNPGTVWPLSPTDQDVFGPKLAVDGQGRVTAVWETFNARVFSTPLAADGSPEEVRPLSLEGHRAGQPQVAATDDGRVVVAWNHSAEIITEESCGVTHFEPEDDVVRVMTLGGDGAPTNEYDISARGEEAAEVQLALDPHGLPWVVWKSYDGNYFCVNPATRVQEAHALAPEPSVNPPVEPPTDPEPGPTSAAPKLRLAKRGTLRDGRVLINAGCHGGVGRCAGAIRLESALRHLAQGRFGIATGRTRQLALPVSKAAKRLLASGNSSWITASARGKGLAPKTVRIRVLDASR